MISSMEGRFSGGEVQQDSIRWMMSNGGGGEGGHTGRDVGVGRDGGVDGAQVEHFEQLGVRERGGEILGRRWRPVGGCLSRSRAVSGRRFHRGRYRRRRCRI